MQNSYNKAKEDFFMWTNLSSDEHPTWEERFRLILYKWQNYVEVQNTERSETSALRNLSSFQTGNWCGNVKRNSVKLKKESRKSRRHTPVSLTETETIRSRKVGAVRPRCGFCGDDSQSEHPSDWRGVLGRVVPECGGGVCTAMPQCVFMLITQWRQRMLFVTLTSFKPVLLSWSQSAYVLSRMALSLFAQTPTFPPPPRAGQHNSCSLDKVPGKRLLASGMFGRPGNPVWPPSVNSHLSSRTCRVLTSCKRKRECYKGGRGFSQYTHSTELKDTRCVSYENGSDVRIPQFYAMLGLSECV